MTKRNQRREQKKKDKKSLKIRPKKIEENNVEKYNINFSVQG